jgi:hypothetical protein
MLRACLLLSLVVLSGCSRPTQPSTPEDAPRTASREDDVRAAVFRYQFTHNASGVGSLATYYFLAFGDFGSWIDPPPSFVARFAEHVPRVEPVSRASVSVTGGVRHLETGSYGVIFRITTLRWIGDTVAEVEGGYYFSGVSASGSTYRVERVADTWVVMRETPRWIS